MVSRIVPIVSACALLLAAATCAGSGWRNSLAPKGEPAGAVELAVRGGTDYVIVVPVEATPQEERAADELAHWLQEMSGAELPVVLDTTDPIATEISVGDTNRRSGGGWDLGPDGYAIVVKGARVFLLGGERTGPLSAVFALLEEDLGCRWYAPGASTVLDRPTIRVRIVPRVYVPAVTMRNTRGWSVRDADWCLRNHVNGNHAPIPEELGGHYNYAYWCHSFRALVPPGTYLDEHPEYFSLLNGRRTARQLCVTNPQAARVAARSALSRLEERPDCELISVSYNDGRGYCQCERCTALDEAEGSRAGSLLTFVNRVAEIVGRERPDVYVSTLAYLDTNKPPATVRPRENVAVRFCTDRTMWHYPFRPVRQQEPYIDWFLTWTDMHDLVTIWDYPVNYSHYLAPMPNIDVIADNIRLFTERGVFGIMEQDPVSRGRERQFMRSWIYAKLMWDPSRDVEELRRDFICGYFQEAAPPIGAYDRLLRETARTHSIEDQPNIRYPMDSEFLTPQFLDAAEELFGRAESLAQSEEILHRVQEARLPIMYVKLQRGPEFVGEGYPRLLERFEAIADRIGMKYVGERIHLGPRLEEWRADWDVYQRLDDLQESTRLFPLANTWRFAVDPENTGMERGWHQGDFDATGWEEQRSDLGMKGWEDQGHPGYDGYAWYRQRIRVPAEAAATHHYLYFGAVDEQAWIYLDGRQVGEHTVKSTGRPVTELWKEPFLVDVSGRLAGGGAVTLAVRVHDGEAMGGIWKPVQLIASQEELNAPLVEALMERMQAPE
ncbi:MAG: DUF4838 domain-containing protein [Armatimonadota bacterium]|nr:DUF4838 domain-containing protein [Armatimonadota bacterium]